MTPSEKIIKFLQNHPLISIHALEKQSEMYPRTLYKSIKGERGIPEKYESELIKILKKYGYK